MKFSALRKNRWQLIIIAILTLGLVAWVSLSQAADTTQSGSEADQSSQAEQIETEVNDDASGQYSPSNSFEVVPDSFFEVIPLSHKSISTSKNELWPIEADGTMIDPTLIDERYTPPIKVIQEFKFGHKGLGFSGRVALVEGGDQYIIFSFKGPKDVAATFTKPITFNQLITVDKGDPVETNLLNRGKPWPIEVDRAAGKIFLPFEGDQILGLILSKAFILAEDTKIKDRTILQQIRS